MLREALPEIVTGSVPGAKAKAILDRRNEAVPKGLCGSTYQFVWKKARAQCLRMWMVISSSTGLEALGF